MIRVRNLATGQTGSMPEENFDPSRYSMIGGGGGGVVQQPGTMQGGQDMNAILQQLGLASQIAGKRPSVSNVLSLLKPTEGQIDRQQQLRDKQAMKGQFDRILKEWEEIPFLARVMPFASRFSKERAEYEVARDRFNDLLITMVADARITDAERKFYLRSFPRMLDSKSVARAKIDGLKKFLDTFSGQTQPTTQLPSSFRPL